MLALV